MRPICWLHISDIHMRESGSWSQDVVLKAMCDRIASDFADGIKADFILITGDLAFSGKANEYSLLGEFFDALITASRVEKESIYCIPGNHDVDRERNKFCFEGARANLQNPGKVDNFLEGKDDFCTLMTRQENYRKFQEEYFYRQNRIITDDQLGYVSEITLADVQLAIVGLNSAWLAEGGLNDHGKLLIGERQVINAFDLIGQQDQEPHIIIGMAHHPVHLLCEFDRMPIQNRIERSCQFFHFGHLHQPETRASGFSGSGCLILGAGSTYETRQSSNSYAIITLDLLQALRAIRTVTFNPSDCTFSFTSSKEYPIEINSADVCNIEELARSMTDYCSLLSQWSHYLSAVLLEQKSELLIQTSNSYTFGSLAVSRSQPANNLQEKTNSFMKFRNVLRALKNSTSLSDIFSKYGHIIVDYGVELNNICSAQPNIMNRLLKHENDARILANINQSQPSSNTISLFDDLSSTGDWELLREHAKRHLDSSNSKLAICAKRMLALSLANSHETEDNIHAVKLYQSLMDSDIAEFTDAGNYAVLLMNIGKLEEAKSIVLDSIKNFSAKHIEHFSSIGRKIVDMSGDREFRETLTTTISEKDHD